MAKFGKCIEPFLFLLEKVVGAFDLAKPVKQINKIAKKIRQLNITNSLTKGFINSTATQP